MMLAFGPSFCPKSGGDDAHDARFRAAACNLKTSGADVHGARLAAASRKDKALVLTQLRKRAS